MAKDLDVTYEDMRAAAKKMNREKERIEEKLQDLKSYIDGLLENGFVTRSASKKFGQDFEEFKQGMSKTNEGLDGLAQYLEKAADSFENLDSELGK
ncbi:MULTISPECIES: WXG100 family type VII secretion target [Streptomyces]|uniref:WXG100 family type VII secretion target n=1 Tax=Streptomyces TaxID=1883 RepID=UPI0004C2A835|nr:MULTISPECIES: WXG100 family type VII secretion target [Streptomyces]MBZ4020021.1 WXG100 family type VII secretion target [Streptomyces purpurogeneiscleroticus]